MNNITPIFSTHASLGGSILTSEDENVINDNSPVSVFAIAKKYNLPKIIIADSSISLYFQCYENSLKHNIPYIWGLKLNICNDAADKSDNSIKTESKVIIWLKNSFAYKDIIKIYTKSHTEDFYYRPRTDWKTLNNFWTENLSLSIPFYGGFFHNNFFKCHCSLPEIENLNPSFLINKMNLPFDNILEDKIRFYAKDNCYEIINTHPIYYYKESDFKAYTVFRCIHNREKFESPNIDNFSSNQFSFESYLNRIGEKIIE